jgi:hypothetical protein
MISIAVGRRIPIIALRLRGDISISKLKRYNRSAHFENTQEINSLNSNWLHEYMLLVLRLNKLIALRAHDTSEYQVQVDREPIFTAKRLLQDAKAFKETIADQGFASARALYLGKLIHALETVSRRLVGERIPLREQALDCFDLYVDYVPEAAFEHAYALYDEGLTGRGSLAERLKHWKAHYTLPLEQAYQLPALIQHAVWEARQRTNKIIALPHDDQVTVEPIRDKPVRAMAHYLGNYQSRILINPDVPFNLADLLYVVCHETYPGHLAELILKENYLIKQRGYREQQVSFLLTPPFVISEGLALWARELVFPEEEAAVWLAEHIYSAVDITPDATELDKVQQATDLFWGVQCNAALMLDDGYSVDDVVQYLIWYALLDEEAARRTLQALQRPFCEAYIFTYYYGRQLLESWLKGSQRDTMIKNLLTQQILPSDLIHRNNTST